jgi:hypothetical protein
LLDEQTLRDLAREDGDAQALAELPDAVVGAAAKRAFTAFAAAP